MGCANRPLSRVSVLVFGCAWYALASAAGPGAPAAALRETATVRLSPQDTFLKLDAINYSSNTQLMTYTWPDNQVANAIVMKFDLSPLPAGATIEDARLNLSLIQSDLSLDTTYTVTVHKLLGKNPVINATTGYRASAGNPWTANACCFNNIPMAQANVSPAYATRAVDKIPGFKVWDVTTMVQEWMQTPADNFGLLLNADTTKPRDRFRYFASMEHATSSLRPFLDITYSAGDTTPPVVAITAPTNNASVSGTTTLQATASDNVSVAGVQFRIDGSPVGPEQLSPPYRFDWDTTTVGDGTHTITASGRDGAGNSSVSAGVSVTVENGVVILAPQDTFVNLDATNYSADTTLNTYTWPDFKVANAILMRFNLAGIPAGAIVQEATLHLNLVDKDASPDATYAIAVHKIVVKNPVIAAATGYTADGSTAWTPNACCHNNVPLAQADISAAYDTHAIDKTLGFKSWTITGLVQEWLLNPATNLGLLLNSDTSKAADRYRFFASMEDPNPGKRPFLRVVYTVSDDTTPPTTAVTAPPAGAIVKGTVTVTASATDNVGVGGVRFHVDGTPIGAEDTTAPYGVSWDTTAAGDGTHTITATARDAAGNSTTSAGVTITVDNTAPTVSISAPANGATLTGTVTVSANASDNAGVAGVQFRLNGANLGSEDMAAPYSVSWTTATTPDGSYTLTAVARDGAGNSRTSAAVTVTVSNAPPPPPPPPPGGIAASYPGDAGIEDHPDVVFVERFEDASLSSVFSRWTDILNGSEMALVNDVPSGSPGSRSLNIPWEGGGVNDGGHLYKLLSPGVDDTLYVRYYIKYPASGRYQHSGIWMGGNNPPLSWPNPQAGVKPAGNDRFIAAAEQDTQAAEFDHYDYWMNMRLSSDGHYWGNRLLNDPDVQATKGQWMCVEHMVRLNTPVTASNGEHAIWLDGVKVSHLGQGFPKGTWSGGVFTQNPAGSPFEGFRWRNDASLRLNWIWLQNYATLDPPGFKGDMKFDHVVVAKNYIGCLTASGPGDPIAPTAALTAPPNGATVSGTVTVAADASDNVGVAGVQFKLDGVNLGAEDTTVPFSIAWDTTTVPNGTHTLTAVARDTAGNLATSAARTVTVSNASSGGVTFESNWDTATGTAANAVTDGGRWPIFNPYDDPPTPGMTVVTGGPNGHNALRVQQRGSLYPVEIAKTNFVPQGRDYYLRYYFRTDDTSSAGDHIATVGPGIAVPPGDNLTFMRKYGGLTDWRMVLSAYGCGNPYGYPMQHWGPGPRLSNGQWYRFEYYVHFTDATHMQVHPRVYDAGGTLLYDADDFRQENWGSSSWNGRNDWTLASFYASGYSFCVDPVVMNDFGLGNNGQAGATNTGLYWYFAAVQIRTDTWPGP